MADGLVLPSQRGAEPLLPPPSARSLLLTMAGEMLPDRPEGAWTTALLRVLGGLGVEDHAGRQVLARSAASGWLDRERVGRAVRWRLAGHGRELVEEGVRRSATYLAADDEWDGNWLMLYVSVPQQQRTTRKRLYGGLDWLGMGNPTPGLWVSPHNERAPELGRLVTDLGLEDTAVAVTGPTAGVGMTDAQLVERSWDLTALAHQYRRLLDQESEAPEPRDADEVMLTYLDLLNLQQRFMRRDPQLPTALLPEWVGREGAALLRERRNAWAKRAHARFWQIVDASA
ncbi:PaaX family transcriptional regulator [Nocardioides sp. Root190]|uniref:PaaX family transcriptional regulator n=1 Tax=Nocardioides sp. Root190 TaxID=1736488 RepID=UPI0006FEBC10|nr:PaaX family transcriptional regulator C-terminal domain-containing protein [Nocardioides sp. Root190]KRB76122.1 PaaX family transcriptional regulator [Nocardioides sp. Root190]